ncbi:hypothetical protein P280DRAFT_467026 [Massarina eburnea CBS 473.64]|uniref:Protein kinase domain-containing protein n=1 Tax=Massarina eburnea CBS 473.64 TaxID=1395130 RepID=A0A6A6SDB9_9PLEO|nr:hypothetical protein P280DRAFT_467026 [Massarina eburnea CBS 473.64]
MADQSPDYKALFYEGQRKLEEEKRRREEAESAQKEEQRRREAAEEKTRKTTLLEFLNACHVHLHEGLSVQTDVTLSTQGDPANANNKLRPERLRVWDDFPEQQAAIWANLMDCDLVSEHHFTSLHTLAESGEAIKRRMMSSELDLNFFQRSTVEDPVSLIINQLSDNRTLRRTFGLQGSVTFENHANTLSPDSQLEEGIEQLTVSGRRRRSPRLHAKAKETSRPPSARSSRPRADQFCVYNTSTQNAENRIAAFIVEYKAPHKLPLSYIYEGLHDMELEDVIRWREVDTPQDRFRRLIAAVITQAFSYMVTIGSEYGCICTGEAFIFLRVPDDPRTVYYFLSVPKGDVGPTTGWAPNSDATNRLHLTAVGQMLAFTLEALKTPPRGQKWRTDAAAQLNSWEVVYNDLLDTIRPGNTPSPECPASSEYQPPQDNRYLRMSPVQLRRKQTCKQPEDQREASDEDSNPDTPSRPFQRTSRTQVRTRGARTQTTASRPSGRREAQDGQYCTQNCLRGLVEGGPLDRSCPNVQDHGESYHQIDQPTFLARLRQQLSKDLDTNCKPASLPGACGVLFRVRLKSYGYTVAAKATPVDFVHRLKREATIYKHLRSIQGSYVPVFLGNVDLETPYYYEGIAKLVHMMFLSFGGKRISQHLTSENRSSVIKQINCAAKAIHGFGVLHNDLEPRNILWNEETRQVMVIDFERAQVVKPRPVLGDISANRKRKRLDDDSVKRGNLSSIFVLERDQAVNGL